MKAALVKRAGCQIHRVQQPMKVASCQIRQIHTGDRSKLIEAEYQASQQEIPASTHQCWWKMTQVLPKIQRLASINSVNIKNVHKIKTSVFSYFRCVRYRYIYYVLGISFD